MTYKEALENIKSSAAQLQKLQNSNIPAAKTEVANIPTPNAEVAKIPTTRAEADNKTNNRNVVTDAIEAAGTLMRVSIPAGTSVNFRDLVEVLSPTGMSVVVRVPLISSIATNGFKLPTLKTFADAIKTAGGTIELLK